MTIPDPFRHHDYPDDVEIIIHNNELEKMERIWARLKKYEGLSDDGVKIFRATLLDEPFADIYDMHQNDEVAVILLYDGTGEPVLLGISLKH